MRMLFVHGIVLPFCLVSFFFLNLKTHKIALKVKGNKSFHIYIYFFVNLCFLERWKIDFV